MSNSVPSATYGNIVIRLRDEYTGGSAYGGVTFTAHAGKSISNTGFFGSGGAVFLSSKDSIIHEAPACVAAPLVTMVAKNAISLGIKGQGDLPIPVRLYAPQQLSITTKHLSVGDVMLLGEPEHGFISCKKLTLSKSTEEDPAHFEVVKSWVMNDDVEIEINSNY